MNAYSYHEMPSPQFERVVSQHADAEKYAADIAAERNQELRDAAEAAITWDDLTSAMTPGEEAVALAAVARWDVDALMQIMHARFQRAVDHRVAVER